MSDGPGDLDEEAIRAVLEEHPVTVAVLFGSYVRGQQSVESDVDIAVAFDASVTEEDRIPARVGLIVDLSDRLETGAVDVTDLDAVDPAVGKHAMECGRLLIGDESHRQRYLDRFEDTTPTHPDTHQERMARLRDIVDRLEA